MAFDEEVAELFCCGICEDLMLAPTTPLREVIDLCLCVRLVCCGRSFCKECLRQWIKVQAQQGGCPRCPGGCTQKLPFRLPKHSIAICKAMEQLVPESLALRIKAMKQGLYSLRGRRQRRRRRAWGASRQV